MTVLDPFDVQRRVLAGELKVLRQSTVGDFDVCFKRAGFNMRPDKEYGTGEARIVGTAYHAGLERYYRGRLTGAAAVADDPFVGINGEPERAVPATWDQITTAAMESFEHESSRGTFDWDTSRSESAERVLTMLKHYFDGGHQWGDEYKVIGVEQEWFAPFTDGWALKGSIDLVLKGPHGVVLDDHKTTIGRKWNTGKEHPRKNTQACFYSWAWWRLTGVLPYAFTFSVMTPKGDFERRWAVAQSHHISAVMVKAEQLTKIVEAVGIDNLPGNPSSNLCSSRYCDWWSVCEFGAAGE